MQVLWHVEPGTGLFLAIVSVTIGEGSKEGKWRTLRINIKILVY